MQGLEFLPVTKYFSPVDQVTVIALKLHTNFFAAVFLILVL